MKKTSILFLATILSVVTYAFEFNVESYQLPNGLTVILNEDHSEPNVFGVVAVKAGSVNEKEDMTGMAHYLEHLMFNGTQNMGTINWEAEKVHYTKIIDLFETLRQTEDEEIRATIIKEINEESKSQSQYFYTKEYVQLLESIGGSNVNAGTGLDMTQYFSMFPGSQSKAWLSLYSNQFINPVFRNFQAELETIYEEFNQGAENRGRAMQKVFLENMFEGSPYGRSIIGLDEHLKSPSLKGLIEFYNTYYVPGNMVLVLAGDFNPEKVKTEIEATFGKWESKPVPVNNVKTIQLEKSKKVSVKITPYNVGVWNFNGPLKGSDEEGKMELVMQLLSNSSSTGLLDQLQTDGDVMSIGAGMLTLRNASLCQIEAVPNFDMSQMRQLSASDIRKLIKDKLELLHEGEIDEAFLSSVKENYIRDLSLTTENNYSRSSMLVDFFIADENPNKLNKLDEDIKSITIEDVVALSKKYLTFDRVLEISSSKGDLKTDDIEKPEIDPILQTVDQPSEFAQKFKTFIVDADEPNYVDFQNDINRAELAEKVDLYYVPNKLNNVFTLFVKYKVGTHEIPTLSYATQLMNNAGIRGNYEPHALKMKMAELGCRYYFSTSENDLTVTLTGREENLEEACKLISMVTLMPDLDDKQYQSLIGGIYNSRSYENSEQATLADAARMYMIYGENSPQLKRLVKEDLDDLTISSLTADFIKATKYEASVHYCGSLAFDELKTKLLNNLAFASGRQDKPEHFTRPVAQYDENTIFILNKSKARQCDITLMSPVINSTTIVDIPQTEAFSNYIGQGLVNIFFQEIREFRSMAYSAQAFIATPDIMGKPSVLIGLLKTQADKTNDAVDVVLDLVTNMPQKESNAEMVRNNLTYGMVTNRPSNRYMSLTIEDWEQMGYTEDPIKVGYDQYKSVDITSINNFFETNIKEKPKAMVIVGDKKKIDIEKLEQHGKVVQLKTSQIFSK